MKFAIMLTLVATGTLSQYAPGVMDEVIHVRQSGNVAHALPARLPDVAGFIALRDCEMIGEQVFLEFNAAMEPFIVADCSGHTATTSWMVRNNIIGEIDYRSAVRLNTVGRGIQAAIYTRSRELVDQPCYGERAESKYLRCW